MQSIIETIRSGVASRETDGDIAEALGLNPSGKNWKRQMSARWVEFTQERGVRWPEWEAPNFTCSLDAAVTLYDVRPARIPSTPMEVCAEALQMRLGLEPDDPPGAPSL